MSHQKSLCYLNRVWLNWDWNRSSGYDHLTFSNRCRIMLFNTRWRWEQIGEQVEKYCISSMFWFLLILLILCACSRDDESPRVKRRVGSRGWGIISPLPSLRFFWFLVDDIVAVDLANINIVAGTRLSVQWERQRTIVIRIIRHKYANTTLLRLYTPTIEVRWI